MGERIAGKRPTGFPEPLELTLVGHRIVKDDDGQPTDWEDRPVDLRSLRVIPLASLTDYAETAARMGGWPKESIVVFIRQAIDSESRLRFKEFLLEPDLVVDLDALAEVADRLSKHLVDRPTQRPETSGDGGGPAESGSEEQAASGDST